MGWAWLSSRYHGLVELDTILNIFRGSMTSFVRDGCKEVESWDALSPSISTLQMLRWARLGTSPSPYMGIQSFGDLQFYSSKW